MKIQIARDCREQLSEFRKKRIRCIDYTYGRQWNDIIEVDGRKLTEYEYILSEGNVPLKNNLIRRIVRNVLGVFRKNLPDIISRYYPDGFKHIVTENCLEELFTRCMEEFLISGMVVTRKRKKTIPGLPSVITEIVSPSCFFFNTDSRDFRGWDIHTVGQFHKVDFNDWCRAFVKTSADFAKARHIFGSEDSGRKVQVTELWKKEFKGRQLVHDLKEGRIFRCPDSARISSLKSRQKSIRTKWIMEEVWRYYFLTDDGKVLLSGDSPYPDGAHPYVMKCFPYLDGEIHSFVADLIDQQRYTNRLITLYDWVIRASAKGVLLIPQGAVEPGDLQNVADQWSRFNGVIVYKNRPENPEPKQISGNLANLGISELLEIQLKMMEDVSGVNGILQGNTSGGNVSGQLYDSQTKNAMYSLSDLLDSFESFIEANAVKDLLLAGAHDK